jgi:hypothetical protein
MTTRWIVMGSLPVVFLIGAVAAINSQFSIAAIAICILAVIVRTRFRPLDPVHRTIGLQPDWIVVLLPTALALRTLSPKGSLLITGLLVAAVFVRKPDGRFQIQAGPLLFLFAATAIVFSRPVEPSDTVTLLTLIFIFTIVFRLITTVDARRIIAGLIDGCGLYLLANVLCYAAGLQSPATINARSGYLVEDTGFVRTIFPLTFSVNLPPIVAAVYVAAFSFLILEAGWLRRSWRLIFLIAAIIVLVGAATRAALAMAVVLPIAAICFPFITRWIAQAATLLAAVSAFILPRILTSVQSFIAPLMSLAPGRESPATSISSLNGRDYIWDRSINYWLEWVKDDLPHMLLGYGVTGQYRSGASLTFSDRLSALVRDSKFSYEHNSFLQQLFDGGVLGWLLLLLATLWASARLSRRRRDWGNWGLTAIVAMTVLLVSAMTEVSLAPGVTQEGFWLLIVLVGVACQLSGSQVDSNLTDFGLDATAAQESRSADAQGPPHRSHPTQDDVFTSDQSATRSISSATLVSTKDGASETESRGVLRQ